jgi:uncharacterized membrane protein
LFAIIITLLVLDLRVPRESTLRGERRARTDPNR